MWRSKMKKTLFVAVASMFLAGCMQLMAPHAASTPDPCSAPVSPISNSALVVVVNVNYTYTPKDASSARPWHQDDVIAYLNTLGAAQRNTFSAQNGNDNNFTLTYTINNDGQDHFTGSLDFSGWGQGHIHTFGTTNPYTDTDEMTRDLTAQAYQFIATGWHDARTSCPQ
jgi:hypothetical protein